MRLFRKVAIVGVGLIGGSIALAIKKHGLADEVVGVSRSRKTALMARKGAVVDACSQDLDIIKGADLVILATPVSTIIGLAHQIAKFVSRDCIVSDVGSTKEEIVFNLERIFRCYVGSHPLAGSEKRGVANAQADIFKNSLCILTPTGRTNKRALQKLKALWKCLGAKILIVNPSLHDKILSFVSHLPHLIAFCLINSVPKQFLRFGSTGLKDTTRIASSEPELWKDIFLSNRAATLDAISNFQKTLSQAKDILTTKNLKKLESFLARAKKKRDTLK